MARRALTGSDLGVRGALTELRCTFEITGGVARVRVDVIEGAIQNPLQVVNNLAQTARGAGATSLRIEGTIANPRLYEVLRRRYGLVSEGATDIIELPLK